MCTAISFNGIHHYFGRNLDLEYAYKECICITPRAYPFRFRNADHINKHYAMIGTATVEDGYPLYYEATNEAGLSMAGLNFPGNAVYRPLTADKDNISPFELIPWILGQCKDTVEAEDLLRQINLADVPFNARFPLSPLHWLISDSSRSIVLEAMDSGVHVLENRIGVLTNNPPFPFHLLNLANFMNLSPHQAKNRFASDADIRPYSNGMGTVGLPGDFSSASRFVKAAFVKLNSVGGNTVSGDVQQFFHILRSVAMPRGSVIMPDGRHEITLYACCCDTVTGVYYYTTYENSSVCAVDMHREDLDGCLLSTYPMLTEPMIHQQN